MKLKAIVILIILFVPSVLFAITVWNEQSYRITGSYCYMYNRYVIYDTETCELEIYGENLVRIWNINRCNSSNSEWQNYDGHADYPEGESVGGCDGSTRYYDCSPVYSDANDFSGQFQDMEQWWYYTSTGSDNGTYKCMASYKNSSGEVIDHRSSDYHSVDPSASSDCMTENAFNALNRDPGSCDQPSNAFNMGVYTTFDDPDSTYTCIDGNGNGTDDNTGAGCVLAATPRAEGNMGDPGSDTGGADQGDCAEGAPVWKVNMVNMNFYMTDIPLWYYSPIGPSVRVQLSYNSQSAAAESGLFGNKWTFNYRSSLDIDADGNITVIMPDGRKDVFPVDGIGGYTRPFGVANTLEKTADDYYRLVFMNGAVYVYKIPEGSGLLTPVLNEIQDAYGQKLVFGYGGSRLETITDALGRVTNLIDNDNDGLVDRIDDPFGRSAHFGYDLNGNLVSITDMGGYSSEFTYDDDVYIRSISNEDRTWNIDFEPADGMIDPLALYPAPGGPMGENYRITMTDPLGNKEEYYYYGAYSWYVSTGDYTSYMSDEINNYRSSPKTIYVLTGGPHARKTGRIQSPEGGYVEYEYDQLNSKPLSVSDHHGSGIRHTIEFSYNTNGLISAVTDPGSNTALFNYYPNDIDVHIVQNGLGTITYTYNDAHDVTSVTDRLNNVTALTYNSYGQVIQIIEGQGTALQSVTMFVYDPVSYDLLEIKKNGNTLISYMYDDIGRIATSTDEAGLSLGYEYNDLDQVTRIIYPDGRSEQFSYSSCCPRLIDSRTARSGLTMEYMYDELNRLISVQHPEGMVRYEYDADGNVIKLTDENGNATSFEYDLDNRPVKKIFADGKFEQYEYDLAGLLVKMVNSRGVEKVYSYDENHNVIVVTYSDDTPGITYDYDDYDRLTVRNDGGGRYEYAYDANNRLINTDGPWGDDMIDLQYDKLGRLKIMTPQKGEAVTYIYDGTGRLTDIQSGPDIYTYDYEGVSPLVQTLTSPNGSYTEYYYNDPLKRLTGIINKRSSGEMISKHTFAYNALDAIEKETSTGLDNAAPFQKGVTTYNYNSTNQLLSLANPDVTYIYDEDGNMLRGYTPAGSVMNMTYDAENRLKSIEYVDEGNVAHRTEYFYNGDNLLAEIKMYEDGIVSDTTRFVRSGFYVLQERDALNNVTNEYTWGIGMGGGIGGLLNLNREGFDYSYLYDGRGNVEAVLDSSQNIAASYGYNVFGKLMYKSGSFDQPFQFSTKRYDEAAGLSYYGYRFYNPSIGRWMTRDPLGEAGGINLYGFVGNDPVNMVDPWGWDATSWFGYGRNPLNEGPRNGNWGGENWSGGQNPLMHEGKVGTKPPLDSADECYQRHDTCYDSGTSKKECDSRLVEELESIDENPVNWPKPPRKGTEKDSRLYRKWAIWWFDR